MTRTRSLALLLALALLGAACSGSDDAGSGGTTTTAARSTTTAEAGGDADDGGAGAGAGADDPYEGHTSEVYDDDANWICRPDLADDQCRDLDVTVVGADGSRTVEEREPAADPPVDCFYVYPTVSSDPGPIADLTWTPEDTEARTVVAQAAQYARACRVFAPVYRQLTLTGLAGAGTGRGDRSVAYGDVLDAWQTYISRWNDGRGVVLIGHSQGTGHLIRLIQEEVDGRPLQERLVAAHLFGGSIQAPEGEVVGGTFTDVPACTSADEAGCVVFWSSYPAEAPPVPGAYFSKAGPDGRSLCVDPTDLLGEERARPVVPVEAPLIGAIPGTDDIDTPFLALPGGIEVSCESTASHDYLAVAVADPGDRRPLAGLVDEKLGANWGLHLVDVNVALDDLVELAGRQAEAYAG